MKRGLIIAFLFFPFCLFGQVNCFDECWNKFTDQKNQTIYQDSVAHLSMKQMQERSKEIVNSLIGCQAPNFTVKTIDGIALSMAELKGKVIVLNFWFGGCEPCRAEIPALNRLFEDYKNTDVVFIAFSKDNEQAINKFLEYTKFNYSIVSDEYDMEQKFCLLLGYPTNIVIDRKGIVRKILHGGFIDERAKTAAYDSIQPMINKCLKEY